MSKSVKVNLKSRSMLPKYSDEELEFLAQRVGLTLEQLKQVQAAATRVGAPGIPSSSARGGQA